MSFSERTRMEWSEPVPNGQIRIRVSILGSGSGRFILEVDAEHQDYRGNIHTRNETLIDCADMLGKAVIRPNVTTTVMPEHQENIEPTNETSAKGVFLPGVSRDDTIIVDMSDGQFRLFDAKNKSFQTLDKKRSDDGMACQCNVAWLASAGCGCRRVQHSPGIAGAAIGVASGRPMFPNTDETEGRVQAARELERRLRDTRLLGQPERGR